MRVGWLLAALAVGLILGYTAATLRLDSRAKIWLSARDSLLATIEVRDAELALADAEAQRLRSQVGQRDTVRLPAPRPRPTVTHPDYADAERELARMTALADTLWSEGVALRERIGRDSVRLAAYARLSALDSTRIATVTAQRDSLRSLIVAAPVGQRGCSLLGVIPCPQLVAGYGATLSDGLVRTGPVVAVGWRIAL